jgi:hypothetical protein
MGELMSEGRLKRELGDIARNISKTVGAMPSHQQFLDNYCGPTVS